MTQHQQLIRILRRRWLSPLDALRLAGTMKLATRVGEIRRTHPEIVIVDKWAERDGRRFKIYRIL